MTKIELVRQEMMKAMKAKDTERKDALSLLLSALKAKFIDKRADLTEEEENAVVYKEIKEAQETLHDAPAEKTDLVRECELRIRTYSEFAPQMMNENEIRATVATVLEGLHISKPTAKDKGVIMKTLMPLVKGRADGALVNKIVSSLF